jgi:hypothetical protein
MSYVLVQQHVKMVMDTDALIRKKWQEVPSKTSGTFAI